MKEKIISCSVLMLMLALLMIAAVKSSDDAQARVPALSVADPVETDGNAVPCAIDFVAAGDAMLSAAQDREGAGEQADKDGGEDGGIALSGEEFAEAEGEKAPQAVPTVPDRECFTYEELADGTLRLTGYDESKNTQNPYQVILPSSIDGKAVSTIGSECFAYAGIYAGHLLELTIPEGITTLEANVVEGAYDICLVTVPDSVSRMDEKAFWRNHSQQDLVIACHDTSYAYQYAQENDFSCRVLEPALQENAFLSEYAEGPATGLPYFGHYKVEGVQYDYISVEYRDNEVERRLQGEMVFVEPNEFLVLVREKESGDIIQCVDSSYSDSEALGKDFCWLEVVTCKEFLSLADWNFDGVEDLCCWQGYISGTGAFSYSAMFLYDKESGLYVNDRKISSISSPTLCEDKQCIYSACKDGPADHFINRYEYVDGVLTHVARLSRSEIWSEEQVKGVEITDERLIDGEWQIYRHEIFWEQEGAAEDSIQDIGERMEVLYVGDGYWDL